mmetsp:Transcript_1160/g.2214  ORF Transcript_1160/g.2214 Transcript_1160/m.2214 type:complete len:203 (-) Transcript_1160:132-740(-)|eukprot:CAMPEP_0170177730 /NCGR_PEP_ID=MMETSP0040_2-20121228/10914_1 /TAXON_ID=641309 /ORGANISM="Lotharella oceanica, Strain CCMP622" /LENGTH=202 /DNA_ID=CAMNT_0010420495 /DNA_START=27 /DNA_END=635 /DNA_ORIENTATION=-
MASTRSGKSGRVGDRKIDWKEINAKLPYQRDKKSKKLRRKMFKSFDPNGNGHLSLAEIDKGLRDVLKLDDVFDCKPAIIRAYHAAKNKGKSSKKGGKGGKFNEDFVEFYEFRYLLKSLRQYFEYWVMFDRADTDDDNRIDLGEFKKAVPLMETWGVKITDPVKTFKQVDRDGGGKILFSEFARWAIKKSLDLDDDVDVEEDE